MTLGQLEDSVANKATCSTLAIGKGYLDIVLRVNWKRRGRARPLATNIISLNRGNDRTLLDEIQNPTKKFVRKQQSSAFPPSVAAEEGATASWQVSLAGSRQCNALFWQVRNLLLFFRKF